MSRRERTFIVAGFIAVGISVILKFAAFPLIEQYERKIQEIELKEAKLEKYLKVVASEENVEEGLNRIKNKRERIHKVLFNGTTSSLVAPDIQKIIHNAAERSSLSIKNVRVLEPQVHDDLLSVPIRVMFYTQIQKMAPFIQEIRSNAKLITIPKLSVKVRNRRKPKKGVQVTMVIQGFMKKGESAHTL